MKWRRHCRHFILAFNVSRIDRDFIGREMLQFPEVPSDVLEYWTRSTACHPDARDLR